MKIDATLPLLFLLAAACDAKPPHVVLTIEDPHRLGTRATSLHFGSNQEALDEQRAIDGHNLPLTVVLTGGDGDSGRVWVEAREGNTAVADGFVDLMFAMDSSASYVVRLSWPCRNDDECPGGFCGGMGCRDSFSCEEGDPCLQLGCFIVTCGEELNTCEYQQEPSFDDGDACTDDVCRNGQIVHVPHQRGGCE